MSRRQAGGENDNDNEKLRQAAAAAALLVAGGLRALLRVCTVCRKKKEECGVCSRPDGEPAYVDASLDLFTRKSPRIWRDLSEKRALSARRLILWMVYGGSIN